MSVYKNEEKTVQISTTVTGDVQVYNIVTRRKYLTSWQHFRMGLDYLKMLAESKLTTRERSVLDMLLYYMEYGNIVTVSQAQIGKDLEIKQGDISKAIKSLMAKELVKIVGQDGRKNLYMVNPMLGFKGYAKHFKGLCEVWYGEKAPVSFKDYQIAKEKGEAVQDELDEFFESDPT